MSGLRIATLISEAMRNMSHNAATGLVNGTLDRFGAGSPGCLRQSYRSHQLGRLPQFLCSVVPAHEQC
eukprot:m.130137 g.130137  ORF g.130137 m.130137 type:complete len:68 (-) comp52331_c1_seq1:63-266(-)